jgi:hypothetical protein
MPKGSMASSKGPPDERSGCAAPGAPPSCCSGVAYSRRVTVPGVPPQLPSLVPGRGVTGGEGAGVCGAAASASGDHICSWCDSSLARAYSIATRDMEPPNMSVSRPSGERLEVGLPGLARHCPGRNPPFLAVKRPARPYKSPIQTRFT